MRFGLDIISFAATPSSISFPSTEREMLYLWCSGSICHPVVLAFAFPNRIPSHHFVSVHRIDERKRFVLWSCRFFQINLAARLPDRTCGPFLSRCRSAAIDDFIFLHVHHKLRPCLASRGHYSLWGTEAGHYGCRPGFSLPFSTSHTFPS